MSGYSSQNAQSVLGGNDKPIANLFYYDFRMNGNKQLIAVDSSGRVKGFTVSASLAA